MKAIIILSFLFFFLSSQAESESSSKPDPVSHNQSSNLKDSDFDSDPVSFYETRDPADEATKQMNALVPVSAPITDIEDQLSNDSSNELQIELESQQVKKSTLFEHPILELGLEYPMNFGVQFKYQLYDFSYVRFGFGFMSGFFLEGFEKLSSSFGYLSKSESNLLSDTFRNSMYLDLRFGWMPYFKKMGGGPYLELGLSNTLLGKGELRGIRLRQSIPNGSYDESVTYSVKTTAYNGTFHIGYSIPFEKIKFNLEVGVIKVLHASSMNLDDNQIPIGSEALSKDQEKLFQKFLEERGWIFPTVSGWISFSF